MKNYREYIKENDAKIHQYFPSDRPIEKSVLLAYVEGLYSVNKIAKVTHWHSSRVQRFLADAGVLRTPAETNALIANRFKPLQNMRNEYEIRGEETAIFIDSKTYGRKEALVSTSDLETLLTFPVKWCLRWSSSSNTFYVSGFNHIIGGKAESKQLHRFIMNPPEDMDVDHINHNGLDNRRSNLRLVTRDKNLMNRKGATSASSSGIRNVHWDQRTQRWSANVQIKGKTHWIGRFCNIEDAKIAVKQFYEVHGLSHLYHD